MSKFIDNLNRIFQAAPQPMGFRTSKVAQPKHQMQLVAAVESKDTGTTAEYATGADAGVLRVSKLGSGARTQKKLAPTKPDIPWGIWLEGAAQEGLKQALELGFDFVIFPAAGTTLAVPPNDGAGIIIQIETSITEGLLRTVNELPVDAVLVAPQPEEYNRLTWYQLMLFQRFATLVTKPVLALVPPSTGTDELQLLWEGGIDGVIIETRPDQPPGEVTRLRQVIDGLKLPAARKRQKMDALLPRSERDVEAMAEIEEEEDEDD
ncbi:MAG TPA: hypothetical protein G4O10_08965 [Dehalococcoidia bacterium]|nr:hypothetical protein [Dehalococcoidia bacterium]